MIRTLSFARFTLEWSTVELDRSEFWVCEDVGRLEVVVSRRGSNASRVTANIRAKPLSARAGVDFVSDSDGLLTFPPGPFKDGFGRWLGVAVRDGSMVGKRAGGYGPQSL